MITLFAKTKQTTHNWQLRPPPFLIGAALVFWGWQTDLMIWALPMALLLEAPQYIRARWEFSNADLNRVFDLCVIIGIAVAVILYNSESQLQFFFKWIQSMPFFFLPIILAQRYGSRDKMELSVFSWVMRRRPDHPLAKTSFNISWIYFAFCLLGASAVNGELPWFFVGLSALIVLALGAVRSRRLPLPFWFLLVGLAVTGGYFAQRFMHAGQASLEVAIGNWLANASRRHQVNYREVRTAIGQGGRMHLTGKIVLRVQVEPGEQPPALLREATFESYRRGVWQAGDAQFDRVFVDTNDVALVRPGVKPKSAVRIAGYLTNGKGVLAIPSGVTELRDFPALLETNRLGVAQADGGPGFVNYLVRYNPEMFLDSPPTDSDRDPDLVPIRDRATLDKIITELDLSSKSMPDKLKAIAAYFQQNFQYSLDSKPSPRGQSPIVQFLTETHSGHCEHFATAATLLLRRACVPARYAVGYAVPESGRHGNTWYVRERHGHAWVMVYLDDKKRWEEFDPTPPSREFIEESRASALEGISDFGSNLWFQFSKWRWGKTEFTKYIPWFLIPLILYMLWRILSGKRRRQGRDSSPTEKEPIWPGLDSELYLINRHLAAELQRRADEPLREWQQRLVVDPSDRINQIFALHRRLRFDPKGLSPDDRKELKTGVEQWLAIIRNRAGV